VIVAVTLDPAVHVSYHAKRILPGTTHRVGRVVYRAGGRGPAVARMLHMFGHEVVAAGLAGGTAGELIRAELARRGVPTQFTPIAMESRRVVEVTDLSSGTTTTFAEPSPYITTEELGRLAADYRGLMEGASAAVLCGGLPDGLPPETYGTFATYAAEAGVPVVLDAGGSALWHGAARRPALVIPEPAGDVRQRCEPGQASEPEPAAGPGQAGDPAGLVAGGVGAVATMSGQMVSVLTADGEWRAWLAGSARDGAADGGADGGGSPAMSRDALVAGFVPGVALSWSWPDSLKHAVSLAATAGLAGDVDLVTYERLLPQVIVETVTAGSLSSSVHPPRPGG
jgi:tagatose 6-phosphate kinase